MPLDPQVRKLLDAVEAMGFAALHNLEARQRADAMVDPDRFAVSGDSAGGNLAAVVAVRIRDAGGPALCGQLLIYPVAERLWQAGVETVHVSCEGIIHGFCTFIGMVINSEEVMTDSCRWLRNIINA